MTGRQGSAGKGGAFAAVAAVMTFARWVIGALILFSIALNFANVVGRYVFFSPIIWAEEVMIFIMIWSVFLGAVAVTWDGRHLKMDLLSQSIPSPWKEAVNALAAAAFLVVCGFVVVQSLGAVTLFARLGQKSTVAGVPMVVPHLALLIGFALMFVAVAVRFRAYVTGAFDGEVADIVETAAGIADGAPDAAADE